MYFSGREIIPIMRVMDSVDISWQSLYTLFCVAFLCDLAWWLFFQNQIEGSWFKHFLARYLLFFYLMLVYIQTGLIGAAWWANFPTIDSGRIFLQPFSSSPDFVPYFYNILMTIPLGFLLPLFWGNYRSLKKVILVGFLFSLSIEITQLFINRISTVDDLIMNTFGVLLGYLGWKLVGEKLFKNRSVASKSKNEASLYLLLSLIGVVFFFHPIFAMALSQEEMSVFAGNMPIVQSSLVTDNLPVEQGEFFGKLSAD